MPRPKKSRKVCHYPLVRAFMPVGGHRRGAITLTVDEYETIRLIDKEGLSQEQCGALMEISRTTVQLIYTAARKKLADALVEGVALRIEGGDFQLCNGETDCILCCGCYKFQLNQQFAKPKGKAVMRIAVPFENGQIFQHFGRTERFKVYDVTDGAVTASAVTDTGGQGHGALAGVLQALGADVLICGGIGGGARSALEAAGIQLYGGVSGLADQAVADFLAGKLDFDADAHCNHHHGDSHHSCGDHACGSHGCHN